MGVAPGVFATISKERGWSAGSAKDMRGKGLQGAEGLAGRWEANFTENDSTGGVTCQVTVLV